MTDQISSLRLCRAASESQSVVRAQLANIRLGACQANDAFQLAGGKVGADDLRRIALAIDTDKDKGDMGSQLTQGLANAPELIERQGANIGAVGIAKCQQHITTAQITQTHPLAGLIGEGEIGHTAGRFNVDRPVKILHFGDAEGLGEQAVEDDKQRDAEDADDQGDDQAIQSPCGDVGFVSGVG